MTLSKKDAKRISDLTNTCLLYAGWDKDVTAEALAGKPSIITHDEARTRHDEAADKLMAEYGISVAKYRA